MTVLAQVSVAGRGGSGGEAVGLPRRRALSLPDSLGDWW